jgi:hypothetical protein
LKISFEIFVSKKKRREGEWKERREARKKVGKKEWGENSRRK